MTGEHRQHHTARVSWDRDGALFLDRQYSRAHEWRFDGGASVFASAAPSSVPPPYSAPGAVDPEEAVVAAASSCHMLWFLAIAAKRGFVVNRYTDEAQGVVEDDDRGSRAFTQITLHPHVEFGDGESPSREELDLMHNEAHAECFIANSLRCEVVVQSS